MIAFRQCILVVGLAFAVGIGVNTTPALALDGNKWRELSEGARFGYVAGVVDTWISVRVYSETDGKPEPGYTPGFVESTLQLASNCVQSMTYEKIFAIVEKYVKEHPEHRHYAMASLVLIAVTAACPK